MGRIPILVSNFGVPCVFQAAPRRESRARCCTAKECISCSRLRRDGCEIARRYSRRRKRAEARHVLPLSQILAQGHHGAEYHHPRPRPPKRR